jgi:eukaryotic-like serine/threonine-protein kinase
MGEVYRAKDARLAREVALKVLPAELSADKERLSRFELEARSASALNHPNIVTVHEIGSSDGVSYIAMELVDGKTLRELVASGPLPIRKLLPIASQVADGLAKAHESGIVHRDLKPENVMVNRDGFAKILDFGLAKLAAPSNDGGSQLQTLAGSGTRPGVVMGTVGYMSPEQASGEVVDFRSDQFSLGSILYEMATGKRAFQKKTAIETLSAILREDPEPIARANPEAPAPLRWIVERCLAKEPADRYAATRDLARDLKQAERHISETSMETPAIARPKRRWGRWAAALAILAAGAVAGSLLRMRGTGTPAAPVTLRRLTFGQGLEDEPSFSPDGKFLAYTTDERGNLDVMVLPLAGGEPIRIAGTDADEAQPAWSPDGSRIAYVSAKDHGGRLAPALNTSALLVYLNSSFGDIFVVPALGGAAAKLVEDGHYPSWSPDGKRIVFMSNRGGRVKLWTVASEGGAPAQLTKDPEKIDYQPAWSPDGKWIAYGSGFPTTSSGGWRFNVAVVPASGGAPADLTSEFLYVTRPAWSVDGKTVFFGADQNGILNLFKVSFRDGRRSGGLSRVTLGQGQDGGATISRDGHKLAFAALHNELNIWEVALDKMVGRAVTSGEGNPDYPHLSPDGKTLLVQSNQTGDLAVWTVDLQGRYLSRLTPGSGGVEPSGRWAPDGTRFGYLFDQKLRIQSLGSLSAQETGVPLTGSMSWSPDGKTLALGAALSGPSEIRLYDVASGKLREITNLKQSLDDPTWSPDGKQIAFMLQRGQVREIWLVPSQGGAARALTKDGEDSHPFWSPTDPDTILFLRDHKRLATLSVSTGKVTILPWTPEGSYVLDYPSWSPDGKKIYVSVAHKTGDIYQLEGF